MSLQASPTFLQRENAAFISFKQYINLLPLNLIGSVKYVILISNGWLITEIKSEKIDMTKQSFVIEVIPQPRIYSPCMAWGVFF